MEILKQAVPGARRPALLRLTFDATLESAINERFKAAERVAQKLGMRLQVVTMKDQADFERAFSDMTKARADALTVPGTALFDLHRPRLAGLAARHRLPAIYTSRTYVEAGGLMSYGPDLVDLLRRTAGYVDKILKGARPGDLPIEQPTKFELVINLKTARALGLTIPLSLLQRADHVIEQ